MSSPPADRFAGAVPDVYDALMVPMIFEPYAADLGARVAAWMAPRSEGRVLELAAGTGALTRVLARTLPPSSALVATDLSQAMLDRARARGAAREVTFQVADALDLPFDDGRFDAVVCQFGVMLFPDRVRAIAEARRVLGPGGLLLYSVWDSVADNDFPRVVCERLAALFPDDPPTFLERLPHGYHDRGVIARDAAAGGFPGASIETVSAVSRAASPGDAAAAFCQGTPMRGEIEARSPGGLSRATEAVAEALAARFGGGAIEGKIQALVVEAQR